MGGALSRSLARGWAGGGRARRYASGGDVDDTEDSASSLPLPPIPPPGGGVPAPPGALASANPANAAPPPQGALNQRMAPGGGGSPDQQDPDAQRKMFDLDRAMSVLRASSGVNPMIAAAGAMLAPTRTGGFSESLGNAFTAYAHGAETERTQDEQAAQRLLQAQWQNDYRQQMASAATSRASSYGTSVADRSQLVQAQSSMDMARAAMLQARAAAGTAAHVTPGDLQAEAMNSLLAKGADGTLPINPDTNNPFTKLEAYNATQAATAAGQGVQQRGTAAGMLREQQQPLIDARVAAIQHSGLIDDAKLKLQAAGLDEKTIESVTANATKLVAADLSGKTKFNAAVDSILNGMQTARAGISNPSAPSQSGGAAPTAPHPAATPTPTAPSHAQQARPGWVPQSATWNAAAGGGAGGWVVPRLNPATGKLGLQEVLPPGQQGQ